jgi:hypothetical protein
VERDLSLAAGTAAAILVGNYSDVAGTSPCAVSYHHMHRTLLPSLISSLPLKKTKQEKTKKTNPAPPNHLITQQTLTPFSRVLEYQVLATQMATDSLSFFLHILQQPL